MIRKGIEKDIALQRINKVNEAFPEALVRDYEQLMVNLELPDKKDIHVLAAAIKTNASLIITNNHKHFPSHYLDQFGIETKGPDDFFTDLIDLNHNSSLQAFKSLVLQKKNPPYDEFQVLEILRRNGLKGTADYLHSLL